MAVALTSAAVDRVVELRKNQPEAPYLRVAVQGGGCSGLSYHLDFVATPDEKDKVFEFPNDVKIVVDRKSYLFVNGTEIDFESNVLKTGFTFKNPQATGTCSCGTSFTV